MKFVQQNRMIPPSLFAAEFVVAAQQAGPIWRWCRTTSAFWLAPCFPV